MERRAQIITRRKATHFRYLDSANFLPSSILFRVISAPRSRRSWTIDDLIKKVRKVNRVASDSTRGEKNLPSSPPPHRRRKVNGRKSWSVGKLSVGIPWSGRSNLSSPHFIDNLPRIWRGRKRGGRKKEKKKIARSVSLYFDPHPMMNGESTGGRTRVIIFLGW